MKFLSVEPLLEDLREVDLTGMDWVIVGGESGRGARFLEEDWVRNLLHSCRRYHVPFFFKQWGGVHKKKAGRKLRGRTYDEFPAIKSLPIPSRSERQGMMVALEQRFRNPHDLLQIAH
jgi:protein gp37